MPSVLLIDILLHFVGSYRYYEGGVSSVYLWELEDGGFAGVVLFKKGTILF